MQNWSGVVELKLPQWFTFYRRAVVLMDGAILRYTSPEGSVIPGAGMTEVQGYSPRPTSAHPHGLQLMMRDGFMRVSLTTAEELHSMITALNARGVAQLEAALAEDSVTPLLSSPAAPRSDATPDHAGRSFEHSPQPVNSTLRSGVDTPKVQHQSSAVEGITTSAVQSRLNQVFAAEDVALAIASHADATAPVEPRSDHPPASAPSDAAPKRDSNAALVGKLRKQAGKVRAKRARGEVTAERLAVIEQRLALIERDFDPSAPEVLFGVECLLVSSVDSQQCTARLTIAVHSEWEAAAFEGGTSPELLPSNAIESHIESSTTWAVPSGGGRCARVSRVSGTFSTKVNERVMSEFPFDHVDIIVVLRPNGEERSLPGAARLNASVDGSIIQPPPPKAVRNFLAPDFELPQVSLRLLEHNGAKFTLSMHRQSSWYVYKIVLPTIALQLVSWAASDQLGVEDFADRLNTLLTVFLTKSAMLYIVSDSIPKVGYLTLLDQFLFVSSAFLFVQMLQAWLVSALHGLAGAPLALAVDWWANLGLPVLFIIVITRLGYAPLMKAFGRKADDGAATDE